MDFRKEYTNIYASVDEYGYLNLLFYNHLLGYSLLFDGNNFYFNEKAAVNPPAEFFEIEFSKDLKGDVIILIGLKQAGDVTYIKIADNVIMQINFMFGDIDSEQQLRIYVHHRDSKISTPLGINLYEAVSKSYEDAEECDVAPVKG